MLSRYWSQVRALLPDGTFAVGIGLALAGFTTYAFLALTARALGPTRYSSFSGFWSTLFLVGPALLVPFEQELGRLISSRRAIGVAHRKAVRRLLKLQVAVSAVLLAVAIALSPILTRELFDGDYRLLVAFLVAVGCYLGSHLVKGITSGSGQFGRYGIVLAAEGIVRVVLGIGLIVSGVERAWLYAVVVAVAPLASLVMLRDEDDEGSAESEPSWRELGSALWHLFLGSVFSAALVSAGPVALKALSTESQATVVSQFLASVVVARIPLFLFQAIQVALLPKLAALAAARRIEEFSARTARLVVAVGGLGGLAALVGGMIGPFAIRAAFGEGFALGGVDLFLLGLACTAYMTAAALAQAIIACERHGSAARAWAAGCAVMASLFLVPIDLVLRVELAMLLGGAVAAVVMGVAFVRARAAISLGPPTPAPVAG